MQLAKITITTTHTTAMVDFYNTVFSANLRPLDGFATLMYEGRIAGIPLLLCPQEILGLAAEPNRQQFKFMIANRDALTERVSAAGGQVERLHDDPHDGGRYAWVRDPDGNTIEFEQPSPAKIG